MDAYLYNFYFSKITKPPSAYDIFKTVHLKNYIKLLSHDRIRVTQIKDEFFSSWGGGDDVESDYMREDKLIDKLNKI